MTSRIYNRGEKIRRFHEDGWELRFERRPRSIVPSDVMFPTRRMLSHRFSHILSPTSTPLPSTAFAVPIPTISNSAAANPIRIRFMTVPSLLKIIVLVKLPEKICQDRDHQF
jgi:hypothetical protein